MLKGIGIASWILGGIGAVGVGLTMNPLIAVAVGIGAFIQGAIFYELGEGINALKDIRKNTKGLDIIQLNTYNAIEDVNKSVKANKVVDVNILQPGDPKPIPPNEIGN